MSHVKFFFKGHIHQKHDANTYLVDEDFIVTSHHHTLILYDVPWQLFQILLRIPMDTRVNEYC